MIANKASSVSLSQQGPFQEHRNHQFLKEKALIMNLQDNE